MKRFFILLAFASLAATGCSEPTGPALEATFASEHESFELEPIQQYDEAEDGDLSDAEDDPVIALEVGTNIVDASIEAGSEADRLVLDLGEELRIREVRYSRDGADELPVAFELTGPDDLSVTTEDAAVTETFLPRIEGLGEFSVSVESTELEEAQSWSLEVDVDDGNEAPTDLELSATSVPEDAEEGDAVATITATDPDPGESFTFTIPDDPDGKFAIDGDQLVVDGALDAETAASHDVTIQVADLEEATYQETFTITVEDVNEPPVADAGRDQSVLLGETVTLDGSGSSDPDEGDELTGSWDLGDGNTAEGLVVTHTYQEAGSYTAVLSVTDVEGLSDTDDAVVTVESPAEALAGFIEEVGAHPILPAGLLHSFEVKPMNALRALERGDTDPALGLLGAFINHVEAQAGKAIPHEDAEELLAMTERIMASIRFMAGGG